MGILALQKHLYKLCYRALTPLFLWEVIITAIEETHGTMLLGELVLGPRIPVLLTWLQSPDSDCGTLQLGSTVEKACGDMPNPVSVSQHLPNAHSARSQWLGLRAGGRMDNKVDFQN